MTNTKEPALFLGRFQPLHNGHVRVIRSLLLHHVRVVVGIGYSQEKNEKNPYSLACRRAMLTNVFGKKISVIAIRDRYGNKEWTQELLHKAKGVKYLYYGPGQWESVYKKTGLMLRKVPRYDGISATMIRRRLHKSMPVEGLVPEEIIELVRNNFP